MPGIGMALRNSKLRTLFLEASQYRKICKNSLISVWPMPEYRREHPCPGDSRQIMCARRGEQRFRLKGGSGGREPARRRTEDVEGRGPVLGRGLASHWGAPNTQARGFRFHSIYNGKDIGTLRQATPLFHR